MERVWIGVGSNLSDPRKQVDHAILNISKLPISKLVACSAYYRSKPLGDKNQPEFLNMVAVLDTNLSPEELLNCIQQIEQYQGRIRSSLDHSWKPRTLDLDILLFGKYNICSNQLIIPHYDMLNREFVMYPLIDLDPDLIFPDGIKITDIIDTIPKNKLCLWTD